MRMSEVRLGHAHDLDKYERVQDFVLKHYCERQCDALRRGSECLATACGQS
jgi:hypothetical protein